MSTDSPSRLPRWTYIVVWVASTVALLPLFIAASWAGSEVGKFQVTTFEASAREALKRKDFAAALKYCNGAIKAGHNRSEHWGRVYTLRAIAYAGDGDVQNAVSELVKAGDFFSRRYYYAKEQDRKEVPLAANAIGKRLLAAGKAPQALEAFSAGAMASAKPVEALYDLAGSLTPVERLKLWGKESPFIYMTALLDPKDNGPRVITNEQSRPIDEPQLVREGPEPWLATMTLDTGAGPQQGKCWVSQPTCVALSIKPFGILAEVGTEPAVPVNLLLSYWFESPQKSTSTVDQPAQPAIGGEAHYDIHRDFYAEQMAEGQSNGYSAEGGIINQIGISLPAGEATKLTFHRAKLYIPLG